MADSASGTLDPADTPHPQPPPPAPQPIDFDIDVYNIYTTDIKATISSTTATSLMEALALNGYLGASPIRPSVAISFSTLELLRCIRLFKASYSIESFAKLVCYYYRVSFCTDRELCGASC